MFKTIKSHLNCLYQPIVLLLMYVFLFKMRKKLMPLSMFSGKIVLKDKAELQSRLNVNNLD